MQRILIFVCSIMSLALANPAIAADSPLRFVREYINEIGSIENVRLKAEKQQAEEPDPSHTIMTCIRSGESWRLELSGDINIMNTMHIDTGSAVDEAPQDVAKLFVQKREIIAELSKVCATMAEGPKDGVDYGAISASLPKFTAQIEYIDKLIFQTSPLVFATLISNRPDSQNHLSHLVITSAERDELIQTIIANFGDKLNNRDQSYAVGIGKLFKDKLLEFHAFDEPW